MIINEMEGKKSEKIKNVEKKKKEKWQKDISKNTFQSIQFES